VKELEGEKEMKNSLKITSVLLVLMLILVLLTPYYETKIIPITQAGEIASAWHNSSSLSVQVIHLAPRINWYDFQYNDNGTWVSRLNQQIRVNNESEYRFIINVSSDQGWENITFINLTAWYDNGNESSTYNQTNNTGGNLNLHRQYENTSDTSNDAKFREIWPKNEVRFLEAESRVVTDTLFGCDETESRNITFPFIPNKQFRYAPGEDDEWNTTVLFPIENSSYYGLYNNYSWNFNISIDNLAGYTTWVTDEFGVYRYSEIISANDPSIEGYPGGNFSVNDAGSGEISIITCTNGKYNLSVDITNLTHANMPTELIERSNVYVRGGNRTSFRSLSDSVFLFGGNQDGMPQYEDARRENNFKNTTNVEYKCYIPLGTLAGEYSAQIRYHLSTEE
jgi:hypothetical protein